MAVTIFDLNTGMRSFPVTVKTVIHPTTTVRERSRGPVSKGSSRYDRRAAGACNKFNAFGSDTFLTTCSKGCCGSYYTRYCCISSSTNNWSSWPSWSSSGGSSTSSFSSAISTAAIIGIVVSVIIVIAIVVGIILCVVCCARAASPTPARRGVVMTNPGVAVVSSQATTNYAYAPPAVYPVPPPQAAYPPPQAAYPVPPQPQAAYPPPQAAHPVPPPSKAASTPPTYESLTTETAASPAYESFK